MRVCKYCREEIEDDLRICPKCGASVETVNGYDNYRDIDTEKNIKTILFYSSFIRVLSSILTVLIFIIIIKIFQTIELTNRIYIIAAAINSLLIIFIANIVAVILENKAYVLKNIYEINKKTN